MIQRAKHREARRGAMTMVVLLALAIVALLSAALVRTVSLDRRAGRDAALRSQAEWLAYSGCQRALARLANDDGYAGETWSIGADELSQLGGARVRITVESMDDQPAARRIISRATYPADGVSPAVRQQTIIHQLSSSEDQSP